MPGIEVKIPSAEEINKQITDSIAKSVLGQNLKSEDELYEKYCKEEEDNA